MERSEFCELLVDLRQKAGMSKYKMCKMMDMLDTHLNRIERGTNSFAISKAIKYLDILDRKIVVRKDTIVFNIDCRENLASLAIQTRQEAGISSRAMASSIGVSQNFIIDMEKNRADVAIDNVLKFFNVTGYELEIVHK